MRTGKDLKQHEILVIADFIDDTVKWEVCDPQNFEDDCKWQGFDLIAINPQVDYLEKFILQIPFNLSKVCLWIDLECVGEFSLSPATTPESVKIIEFLRLIGINRN